MLSNQVFAPSPLNLWIIQTGFSLLLLSCVEAPHAMQVLEVWLHVLEIHALRARFSVSVTCNDLELTKFRDRRFRCAGDADRFTISLKLASFRLGKVFGEVGVECCKGYRLKRPWQRG